MRVVWTDEAIADLANIVVYYAELAGAATAEAIENRIASQIEKLRDYPMQTGESERVPGAREAVIQRLPYVAFVRVLDGEVQVLNVVHTARRFPA